MNTLIDFRFSYQDRLHRSSDYACILKTKPVKRTAWFVLHLKPAIHARLGLVVPKRFAARAVTRNTIKRCIRESFRLHKSALPAYDYVVRLNRKIPAQSLRQLRQAVKAQVDQLWQ